jgi:hypothetical protein
MRWAQRRKSLDLKVLAHAWRKILERFHSNEQHESDSTWRGLHERDSDGEEGSERASGTSLWVRFAGTRAQFQG